jgi:uncharacterized damage-inducible protein DinB
MTTGQELLQELTLEAKVTRRFLERVPFDKAEFRPHEKSEKLGPLAIHVAEIIGWWKECIENESLDFIDFKQKEISSTADLLTYFDILLAEAKESLREVADEDLNSLWSMKHGDEVLFTLPKRQVLRIFCLNHLVSHRAQLGVYLRILGVPVPATYGPSADDEDVILITPFDTKI